MRASRAILPVSIGNNFQLCSTNRLEDTHVVLLRESRTDHIHLPRLPIFGHQNNFTNSLHRVHEGGQKIQTIKDSLLYGLEQTSAEAFSSPDSALERIAALLSESVVSQAYGNLQRCLSPLALKPHDAYRFDGDTIFKDIRQVQELKRQISSFAMRGTSIGSAPSLQPAINILENLCQDLYQLQSLDRSKDVMTGNDYLGQLIEDQTKETRQSLSTSEQISRLSRLAFIFLPLQLTTSILGMNLELFGAGTLAVKSFVGILTLLCVISFLPVVLPQLQTVEIIRRGISAWQYSRNVGFIYICFALTHTTSMGDDMWKESGIPSDIAHFRGAYYRRPIGDVVWTRYREDLAERLRRERWSFFPDFWRGKLSEIYEIIDKPHGAERDRIKTENV